MKEGVSNCLLTVRFLFGYNQVILELTDKGSYNGKSSNGEDGGRGDEV